MTAYVLGTRPPLPGQSYESNESKRDELRNNDSARALDEINLADTELFEITQNLPPS